MPAYKVTLQNIFIQFIFISTKKDVSRYLQHKMYSSSQWEVSSSLLVITRSVMSFKINSHVNLVFLLYVDWKKKLKKESKVNIKKLPKM